MEIARDKECVRCAGCLNVVADGETVTALQQRWHTDCFRCSMCDSLLCGWYVEREGLLFCREHYRARFTHTCHRCGQVMSGPVMCVGEHRYHPECFTCAACATHIEEHHPCALLERSTLYCGECYAACEAPADAHCIRVLWVPDTQQLTHACGRGVWCALRAALALCAHALTTRTERGVGCAVGGVTLRAGDRLLEVHGVPGLVQITIEHNPTVNEEEPSEAAEGGREGGATFTVGEHPTCDVHTELENTGTKSDVNTTYDDHQHTNKHNGDDADSELQTSDTKVMCSDVLSEGVGRERLFKRRGEEGGRTRVLRRRHTPRAERSSSMSKLLDVEQEEGGVESALSRARSFRAHDATDTTVFRPADLLQGELLGSGFFGEVYKVTHRDTNQVMVLKQLYRVDDDAQRNFLKEVAVLRSLAHPNVLRFMGVVYREGRLHLVTEYVSGGTLHALLQDGGVRLGWRARCSLARDVAAGVRYLHRRHVIHRDLNSHNCLVRHDMTLVVADFGLARIVRCDAPNAGTLRRKRYTVVGNPYWMAPEMMNGNVYDEKVDVFSFGIILCEIIGRVSADPDYLPRRPDFGLNERAFMEKFCAGAPEPLYRVAFSACRLEPDARPTFDLIEPWLERLLTHLARGAPPPPALTADIMQHAAAHDPPTHQLHKSQSSAALGGVLAGSRGAALGKCVSATHVRAPAPPPPRCGPRARSTHTLTPAYILRERGDNIDITQVADISAWMEPAGLRRAGRDAHLDALTERESPALRPLTDSESSEDELVDCRWQQRAAPSDTLITNIIKKGETLLAKRSSYEVTPRAAPPRTSLGRKLLSPKLRRLFGSGEGKDAEPTKSKFFVPAAARVRPLPGGTLTPPPLRRVPHTHAHVRHSCRDRTHQPAPAQGDKHNKREGICRSNYVSLANLKINGKDLEKKPRGVASSPVERVM